MALSRNQVEIAITAQNRATAVIRQVRSSLTRLSGAARSVGRGMVSAFGAVTNSLFSLRSGLVAVAGVAGLGFAIRSSYEYMDALGKLSTRIGITTAQLQTYQVAANLSGGSTEGLNNSLDYFTRAIGEAKTGTGELRNVLNELGINTETAAFRNMEAGEALELFLGKLSTVTDETLRANYAQRAFGRSGRVFSNIVANNGAALTDAQQRVKDFGIALSEDTIRNVERANDSFYLMGQAFGAVANKILGALAPALEKISEWFGNFFGAFSVTVEPYINYLIAAMQQYLPQSFDDARAAGEALAHSFGAWLANLPPKVMELLDKFRELKDWIMTNGPGIWENIKSATTDLLFIINSIKVAIDGVISAFRYLWRGNVIDINAADIQANFVPQQASTRAAGTRASGGAMQPGQSYMVGERGPEMISPRRSGVVRPSSGGQTIVNNIYTAATAHGINNALAARADTGIHTTRVGMSVRNSFAPRGYTNLSSGRVR